ncbi:MAG: rhodanese-related sulfurtransferase [Alphaproteobacteria bacterium]|jgi:rhodanese-related sulfurtransferase
MKDRTLTSEQAFEKAQNNTLLLIDIRRIDEWQATGIGKGAVALTMDDADFLKKLQDLTANDTTKPIGIICAAGGRSARVCQALHDQGYDFVFDVAEGMNGGPQGDGWIHKNIPIVAYDAA